MSEQSAGICIIGIGMGALDNLTVEAERKIEEAQVLIGARRMIAPYQGKKECFLSCRPEEIVAFLEEKCGYGRCDRGENYGDMRIKNDGKQGKPEENEAGARFAAAVLMSGDSGFYSGAKELLAELERAWGKEQTMSNVTVLPGISSLSYFCARIGKAWEDVEIVNLHGTGENLWPAVLTHERVFAITGGNLQSQLQQLAERGMGERVRGFVGECLSYPQERISAGSVSELAQKAYESLSVVYLENPAAVSGNLTGLPDDSFIRGEAPMTKAEVRAVVMSKLRVKARDTVYDIGAGTGSVSVEMALAAGKGRVYSIESSPRAIELCKLNKERFGLHNMYITEGTAPEIFAGLPAPDVAFIGGSRGRLWEIVDALLEKNPGIRLVIDTATVESAGRAFAALDEERFCDVEAVQMQINRARKAGSSHMMTPFQPVTVFSARGRGEEARRP